MKTIACVKCEKKLPPKGDAYMIGGLVYCVPCGEPHVSLSTAETELERATAALKRATKSVQHWKRRVKLCRARVVVKGIKVRERAEKDELHEPAE